jgi:hypothetical protein
MDDIKDFTAISFDELMDINGGAVTGIWIPGPTFPPLPCPIPKPWERPRSN